MFEKHIVKFIKITIFMNYVNVKYLLDIPPRCSDTPACDGAAKTELCCSLL